MISESVKTRDLSDQLISITAPAYNEYDSLIELCNRIQECLNPLTTNYEIIIVDNHSTDGSLELLRKMVASDSRLKYVRLSKNFGHFGGIIAGMEHCSGDIIITMDADLQHPPEVIPEFLSQWCQGYNVVGTRKRTNNQSSKIRHLINQACYKGLGWLIGFPLIDHQSDFRLLDRAALSSILALPEKRKFLRGLAHWVGFTQTSIDYEVEPRRFGKTKISILSLISFAISGLISFSILPLRLLTFLGLSVSLAAFIATIVTLVGWLMGVYPTPDPGWLTLAIGIYFIGGVQLLGMGLLGEYMGQILRETRSRPVFIVEESTVQVKTSMKAGING